MFAGTPVPSPARPVLWLISLNKRFRRVNRCEPELTRQRAVAGLNANVKAFSDPILFDAVSGASGRNIGFPSFQHLHDVAYVPKPIRDASGHSGSDAQRLGNARERTH